MTALRALPAAPALPVLELVDAVDDQLAKVDDSDDHVIELVSIKARASTPNALSRDRFETTILRRGHVARRVIALGLIVAVVIACPWAASFARGAHAQATPHVATATAPVLAKATTKAVVPAKVVAPAKNAAPKKNATKS